MAKVAVGKTIRVIQTIANDGGAENAGVMSGEASGSAIGFKDPAAGSKAAATAAVAGFGYIPFLNEDTGDINFFVTVKV